MRLTLRTLLAYLDGNLEPDDAADIGKKIEESEFASKLVHLIRDATRRLRLGSPALIGRGLGADPNTVAEYLEYRLADDRVPEFEKICLESEAHLAEVASCHQILTLVLGEPAEIDPQMRQRLYGLPAHVDAPPVQNDAIRAAVAKPPAAATPPPMSRRPKPEVPEYLRESRSRLWPVAAVVLLAAGVTFAGLLAFGPAQFREQVTALVQSPAEQADADPQDATPSEDTEQQEPAADESGDGGEPTGPVNDEPEPQEPAMADDAVEDEPEPTVSEPALETDAETPPAPELQEPASRAPDAADPIPPLPAPLETQPPSVEAEMPDEPLPDGPGSGTVGGAGQAEARREPPEGFGRYTSKREVLLRRDPVSGDWMRLSAMSPLDKGDRLLSLPLFRPTITLSSNITVQADGAASFELVGWTDDGVPILSVEYGRLLMLTIGKAGNSLQLKIGEHEPLLTFVDPESTLAIEVRRELPPSQDPEAGPAPMVANLYATSGAVRLQTAGAAPVDLQSPATRPLVGLADDARAESEFPQWVTTEIQSDADRQATGAVDGYLTAGKPVGFQLRELCDQQTRLGKRREVRALAIRSLVHMGDFNPCVAALREENERFFWRVGFEELQAAIARSPAEAAAVRSTFDRQRGVEDGRKLYRMLWGYSAADLKAGADRDLVEGLNRNDALDVRVLSILNLENATGWNLGYHPEDSEIKRNRTYNAWRKRLGQIPPQTPPPGARGRAANGT